MINIFEETMAHMTYVEIEEAAQKKTLVLFPVGVIEEHGPHLPLAVDAYGAYLKSRMIKSEVEKRGIKVLIAPPFYWGMNRATDAFGGTFTCREETVIFLIWDIMASLKRWGFEKVFFVNHHLDGTHMEAVDKAMRKAREDLDISVYWLFDASVAKRLGYKGNEDHLVLHETLAPPGPPPQYLDLHAGSGETSFMWHHLPELVRLDILKNLKATNLTLKDLLVWRNGGEEARKMTPQGHLGDPGAASPEKGKEEMEAYGRAAAGAIEAFLTRSAPQK
jgi:creatinine amidohydrolase